jgi:transglutaminase-like putative cysteine protease
MLLCIDHETRLTYTEPVAEHVCEVRMAPLSDEDQTALGYRLRINPGAPATAYRDGFGNRVDLFNLSAPCQEVLVRTTSYVRTHRRPGAGRLAEVAWPGERPVSLEALEFQQPSPLVNACAEVEAFLATLPTAFDGSLAGAVQRLMEAVRERLKYEKKVTSARTPVGEALTLGRGVCQDFAHLFLAACRGRGLPARYVSGYVNQPGEIATHAWVQVWGGPTAGWIDVDPTHNRLADDEYVVTALGRDYSDVPPNRGAWKGRAEETIAVTVKVEAVQRLPADWIELDSQPSRSSPASFQVQRMTARSPGLSHQAATRGNLRHQKSQQQQTGASFRKSFHTPLTSVPSLFEDGFH